MQNRIFRAFVITSISVASTAPALAGWSPLAKDVAQEVKQSEKSPALKHFHALREKIDKEQAEQLEAAKKSRKGIFKMFKRVKVDGPELNLRDSATPPDPKAATEDKHEDEQVEEPGTAPAKELLSVDKEAEGEASDDSEEPPAPKQKKRPGQQPSEEVMDPSYFIKRSQSFCNQKDYQSALNYVDRALELQPQNWEAWYQKGLTYQLAGYDAAAAKRFLKLIAHKPDMIEARIALGILYRKHGNFDLAEQEYKAAIEHKFYSFPAHFNLANLLLDQKKYEAALKEYKVCLKLQPNNALVHNNLGVIFQQRNYLEEAADEFRKASSLDPANKLFSENLANVRTQLGQRVGKPATM